MGHCGSGKTHFINKMCNANLPMGVTGSSYTRDIDYLSCAYFPQNQFLLYDSPGTNSKQNAITHALILRRTISCLPLNLIIIQAQFHQRYKDNTLTELRRQSRIFKGVQKYIIFIISNLDFLDNPHYVNQKQKIIQQFFKQLKNCKFNEKVILYSNINSNFQALSTMIYDIGLQNTSTKINIYDQVFFKYFKLQCNLQFEQDEIRECAERINKVANCYINYLRQQPYNLQDADNLISQLKIYLKQDLKNTQNQDYKIYYDKMGHQKSTDLYLMISQIIQSKLEQFDDLSLPKLNRKYYYQYDNKPLDIRDLYKQCPSCKQIWMRAYGCDGYTTCGNKPQVYDFFSKIKLFKYQFIRRCEKIIFRKVEKNKVYDTQLNQNMKTQKKIINKMITKKRNKSVQQDLYGEISQDYQTLSNCQNKLKIFIILHNFQQIIKKWQKRMKIIGKMYKMMYKKMFKKLNKVCNFDYLYFIKFYYYSTFIIYKQNIDIVILISYDSNNYLSALMFQLIYFQKYFLSFKFSIFNILFQI